MSKYRVLKKGCLTYYAQVSYGSDWKFIDSDDVTMTWWTTGFPRCFTKAGALKVIQRHKRLNGAEKTAFEVVHEE